MSSPEIAYSKGQLHIHSREYSDGVGSIDENLDKAQELGMDVVAFMEHDKFNIEAKNRAAQRNLPLQVGIAIEITSRRHHIGGLFLTDNFPTTPPQRFMSIDETLDWIEANNGLSVLVHPGTPFGIRSEIWPRFKAIEFYCPVHRLLRRQNRITRAYYQIPKDIRPAPLAGGDIHFPTYGWDYYVIFPGKTLMDLNNAIIEKATIPYEDDFGLPGPSLNLVAQQLIKALIVEPIESKKIQAFLKSLHR